MLWINDCAGIICLAVVLPRTLLVPRSITLEKFENRLPFAWSQFVIRDNPWRNRALSSLEFLFLGANALQGSLPTEIGQLRSLTRLELARIGLSSSLPRELGNLVNLQLLDAGKNSLTGEIPSSLGNLRELVKLNLMGNYLSGTIPSDLGRCTSLLEIQLQRNDLTGTVGEEICSLRQNHFLDDLRVDCVSKVQCDVSCCTRCT